MKTNLLAPIVLALFAFARALFAQDYMLPIGSNLDNHTNEVYIQFSGGPNLARDRFLYEPAMGEYLSVIRDRARALSKGFKPVQGYEDEDGYFFSVTSSVGPYLSTTFKFQKVGDSYVVPDSVLDFQLDYGKNTAWFVPGVNAVDMDVETSGGQRHFSSRDGTSGSTPCFISTQSGFFGVGWVLMENTYTIPKLQTETGVLTGSTVTLWQDARYVTFNMLDGSFVGSSDDLPDFMPYLLRPTVQPKVTGLRLRDGLAEISVNTGTAKYFLVEYSTDFSGESWELVAFSYVSGTNGQKVFHYPPPEAKSGFYRVRIPDPSYMKVMGAKVASPNP